ncbi:hypothetical protein BGX20_003057 [Mortierella sp. AD010]|nr:hypothetical protein BGX20_003057 [Mortierella sp. AD010]
MKLEHTDVKRLVNEYFTSISCYTSLYAIGREAKDGSTPSQCSVESSEGVNNKDTQSGIISPKNGHLQDEPTIAKKHQWELFEVKDENDEGKEAQPSKKAPSMPRTVAGPDPQNRAKLADAMCKNHPIATLNAGTLKTNINRLVEVARDEALSIIQSAVQFANDIKR